ncbi:TonB-dependent receptor plug domain-containing protein [Sphingobium lignivorans]|uniref:Iron complex outermembrane receptor protein n=1 Tax=Sphingobium lignivorans TaxID=2735886 RepID=A0ABR6NAQ8_9SPHN|nr:TonB-dependent receptor [Sphingobium lignivorans]MBB5984364.1 iron complex outermembrane receptor protein [Sphingobium lignivorans]
MIYRGTAVIAAGLFSFSAAWAQDVPAEQEAGAPAARDSRSQEAIVVTGSLIRGLPREYIASPVFTYDKTDVVRSGANSMSEYILTIPQNFASDLSDFGTAATSIGTSLSTATSYNQYDAFAAFALRGLASDATLTLVNGRRMASVGMVEASTVSVIPSALIERIDIISDGASATYGADAVAGVVNIVTRKAVDGVELRARGGVMTETGATSWDGSILAGHSWGSGSVYGIASYQRRDEFVTDPVISGTTPLQISQLPQEDLSGFYAGVRQEVGDVTLSVDGSRFQRDRRARLDYPNTPNSNRDYQSRTTGWSINGNMHWDGGGETAIDVNLDYGETDSGSALTYGSGRVVRYNHQNTLLVAEVTGQTALASLPAGPLIVAGGAQYRDETLETDAAIFFHRAGGKRTARSVFGEVNVPFVSPDMAVPLVRSLTLSAALRYEDVEFDSALAPKIGVRWQIDRSIALRGTYARSFLVPRFRDTIGIAEQVSFWSQPYPYLPAGSQNSALPAGDALAIYRAGANPGLETQKADTFTAGIDLTPAFIPDLSIKAGYYRIKINGRVVTPSQTDAATLPDLQGFNILNPSAAQISAVVNNPTTFRWFSANVPFVNGGRTVTWNAASEIPADLLSQVQVIIDIRPQNFAVEFTDGLDLDFAYSTRLLGGTAQFHLTGQYILNLNLQAGSGAPVSRLDGYAQASDLRLNGSLVWGRGGVSLGTVVNYVDGFTDNRPNVTPEKVGSYTTASLFLGLDLDRLTRAPALSDAEVQLVAANVFDQRPPTIRNGYLGYDPYNNPPNPRTISLVLAKRFAGL